MVTHSVRKLLTVSFIVNGCLLLSGFVYGLREDYHCYQNTVQSAPFSFFVYENVLLFLVPSIACFLIAQSIRAERYQKALILLTSAFSLFVLILIGLLIL